MTTVKAPPNGTASEWIKYLGAVSSLILVVVLAPTITVLLARSVSHGSRLAVIEGNRFTAADAMRMYAAMALKADKSNVPPPEVTQSLIRLHQDMRDIKILVEAHMFRHADPRGRGSIGADIMPPGEDDP